MTKQFSSSLRTRYALITAQLAATIVNIAARNGHFLLIDETTVRLNKRFSCSEESCAEMEKVLETYKAQKAEVGPMQEPKHNA